MRPAPVSVTFKHDCMAFPRCAPLPHNEWLPPPEPQGRCEGESSIVDLLWNPRLHYSRPPLSLNPSHAPAYIAFLQQALAREGGRAAERKEGILMVHRSTDCCSSLLPARHQLSPQSVLSDTLAATNTPTEHISSSWTYVSLSPFTIRVKAPQHMVR